MAALTATAPLTLEQFRERYKDKPYEYWHGEAVRKGMPTWLHGLLQGILNELLARAGYSAGPELDLRIDPDFEPRPDVAAGRQQVPTRYPTRPDQVEIVIEVLSPDDKFTELIQKCRDYSRIGIKQVFLADPESKTAWQWDPALCQFTRTETWTLTNNATIELEDAWNELRKRARLDKKDE